MVFEQFVQFLKEKGIRPDVPVLVACSGGLDSTVLVHLAHRAGMNATLAHVNFGLRGEESNRDEAFVRQLALQLGVASEITSVDTEGYAERQRTSIQVAARELRYSWFAQLQAEKGFHWTLTAHHADDNIETLLHHFFRGTGIDGLTGIPDEDRQRMLLRPLLACSRSELEAYAKEQGIVWVDDSSNLSVKYTRNAIRHELLPLLERIYPTVRENLNDNIRRFRSIGKLYHEQVEQIKEKIGRKEGADWRVPVAVLRKYNGTSLPFELLRQYGFGEQQVHELGKLYDAPSGRYLANERFRIIRHRAWLIFTEAGRSTDTVLIREGEKELVFDGGELRIASIRKEALRLDRAATVAQLDERVLQYPLILRKWKAGDYFYPFGMRKKKKLARFFIDQKLAKHQKEAVWVLESAGRIAWVVGYRIDDRFRITDQTRSLCVITVKHEVG